MKKEHLLKACEIISEHPANKFTVTQGNVEINNCYPVTIEKLISEGYELNFADGVIRVYYKIEG